jgi:hypothetical protein
MTRALNGRCRLSLVAALAVGLAACSQDAPSPVDPGDQSDLRLSRRGGGGSIQFQLSSMIESMNSALAARQSPLRVKKVETITNDPLEMGVTVYWKDVGNKRIGDRYVPGDPRRALGSPEGGWSPDPTKMTYAIDPVDGVTLNGVPEATTSAEIRSAMATWDAQTCSDLGMTEIANNQDIGWVADFFGIGGSDVVVADIQHAGWLELEFGGATVGATYWLIWVDGVTGEPTDIDHNGMNDTAFAETYYDAICDACSPVNFWKWEVADGVNDPGIDVDIQSIALHESGHGLSQDHFGTGFVTDRNGFLHLTQDAVMAASYVYPKTELQGPDIGGHCGLWASWPES